MSKVICDICGTTYPETADNCPICGYAQFQDVELTEEDLAPIARV
jgi:rubrerythrin